VPPTIQLEVLDTRFGTHFFVPLGDHARGKDFFAVFKLKNEIAGWPILKA
jgi:hypothetical protein